MTASVKNFELLTQIIKVNLGDGSGLLNTYIYLSLAE